MEVRCIREKDEREKRHCWISNKKRDVLISPSLSYVFMKSKSSVCTRAWDGKKYTLDYVYNLSFCSFASFIYFFSLPTPYNFLFSFFGSLFVFCLFMFNICHRSVLTNTTWHHPSLSPALSFLLLHIIFSQVV